MRKLVLSLLGAASLTMGSAQAQALTVFDDIDALLLALAGSEFFGATLIDEPGAFSHQFDFILGGDSAANASVTTTVLGQNDIDFASILLDGFNFTQTGFDGSGAENWELASITLAPGLHSIFVNGSVAGTSGDGAYSGVLNVAPVPEPGTWAMMLLGFGATGYAMRRRRKPALQIA